MPRLEIESVVHVSSEDPLYPAKNLLSSAIGNDVKKWINQKNGEKQAYIVFKLKEKSQITNLTVGNQNSSFIELLVGDDNISEKEYQVLLPATEILTLREARGGSNKTGVHFFTKDDFNKEAVEKKWSRVKVVCSQPYDPHCRYGLSCFVLKSICDESEKSPKRNDTQTIAGEDKNDLSDDNKDDVNSWKQDMLKRLDASTSSPSQPSTSTLPFNRIKLNKPDDKNNQQKSPRKHSSNEKETTKQKEKKETTPKQKEKKEAPQRDPDPPERPQVDFNKILQDVRFSLSGYENPLRSEIRNKGLEMGAKYSNDWDARCTHLICAFINTPKFNKVKGQGKIVTRDWIEQCHSKRRRLPWRKFALDNRDRQQPISEEDEEDDKDKKETKNKARADRRRRLPSESSSDTEDEIQRVQARKQRKTATTTNAAAVTNGTAPKRNQKPATKTRDELYNADTDVSEDDEEDEFGGDNSDADPDFKPGSQEDPDDSFVVDDDDDHDVGDSETQVESDSDEDEPKKKKPRKVWMGKPLKVKKERKKGDVHDLSLVSRVADTKCPDTTNLELPALPEMPPHTYYIAEDEKGVFREYLIRYITAFDGTIFDQLSHRVDYAITDSKSIAEKIINEHPTVVTVKSEWIWDSYETDKLLPTDNYHFS